MISFLGIIPARFQSTRFPGKPLVKIKGKSMIQHVYERASLALDEVWVATEDDRILSCVEGFGGNVLMTSPDHQSGTDRCAEALRKYREISGREVDVVVNIQGDEPFVASEQIELIKSSFKDENTKIATLVKAVNHAEDLHNPNRVKVVRDDSDYALYFSRSPIPYLRGEPEEKWHQKHAYYVHIGMYAYRTEVLEAITALPPGTLEMAESLEQLRWIQAGFPIKTAVTVHDSMGIDTPDDLEKVLNSDLN